LASFLFAALQITPLGTPLFSASPARLLRSGEKILTVRARKRKNKGGERTSRRRRRRRRLV